MGQTGMLPPLPARDERTAAAAGMKDLAGQNRNVTILFVDICDFTPLSERLDQEDVYALVREFSQRMGQCVSRYDGLVDKMTGDGLMALFGAPVAYENNAERAVRAALDMLSEVTHFSQEMQQKKGTAIRVRIGLNSGQVVVGGISTPSLINYTAIGNTVNLASRLCSAAEPGTAYASEHVYRMTRHLFNFQSTPMLTLKGITQPVQAFRVLDARPRSSVTRSLGGQSLPMVGRDAQLEVLLQCAQSLTDRRLGQFVLITGEAGIGKSRLLQVFKQGLNKTAVRTLEGQSEPFQHGASYALLGDLIRNSIDPVANAGEDQAASLARTVGEVLQDQAAEYLPYLSYVTLPESAGPQDGGRFEFLDSSQLRMQIFLAVRTWFLALSSEAPLVLILDDLHWADEPSLEFVKFLVDTVRDAPLLIVASTRTYDPSDPVSSVAEKAAQLGNRFIPIDLDILSPQESEQVLMNLLAADEIPPHLKALIAERSGGLPLYLEEFLRTLLDTGMLVKEGSALRLTAGLEQIAQQVPDTIEGLVLGRFDRLADDQKKALQRMAVVGTQFNISLLLRILPDLQEQAMLDLLSSLAGRGLLLPAVSAPHDPGYSFKNSMTAEIIYNTLLRPEKMALHGAVGLAIEQACAGSVEPRIEELAHHFSQSAYTEKAFQYLLMAGDRLARDYANARARSYYQQALDRMPRIGAPLDQAYRVLQGLGDVEAYLGDYQAARGHYQQALEAVREQAEAMPEAYISLIRKVGATFEREGDYAQALEILAQAQSEIGRLGKAMPIELAQLLNDSGWIAFRRGELETAEAYLSQALELVEQSRQYDLIASIYNRLGGVSYQKDQVDLASAYTRKALALRIEIGDTVSVARTYSNLGLLEWKSGDWNSALEDFKRSVDLHAKIGDVEGSVNLMGNLGLLELDRGDLEDAGRQLAEALRIAEQINHPFHIGVICLHLSRLYISLRRWDDAASYGERSVATLKSIGSNDNLVDAMTNVGSALLGRGETDKAYELAREAFNVTRSLNTGRLPGKSDDRARVFRLLADISTVRRDYDQAIRSLQESSTIFEALDDRLEVARCGLRFATILALKGDRSTACQHAAAALSVFRGLGAKHDLQMLIATAKQMRIPLG